MEWVAEVPAGHNARPRFTMDCVVALRDRPGDWAEVASYQSPNSAFSCARTFRDYGCEAKVRKLADARHHVYARWPE